MDKQQIRPFAWGAVAGAIVLSIFMFSTGWAVTNSTAEMNAREFSQANVLEKLAAICVAQFKNTENKEEKLTKLTAIDLWKRGNYVSKQGWATMPGSDAPTTQVANECATRIAHLSD